MQSRYYNPETGRFLNADIFASTGQGLLGNNMFAYCGNAPVTNFDPAGSYYASAEDRITTGCGGRGGIPVSPTKLPDSNTEDDSKLNEVLDYIANEDEQVVLDAEYVAFYKGKLVVKVPNASAGFSCGIMFIGNNVTSLETVKHEYGHTKQWDSLGLSTYLCTVVFPSVICFSLTETNPSLNKYYFSLPWERKADELGGATDYYLPGSGLISDLYWGYSNLRASLSGF